MFLNHSLMGAFWAPFLSRRGKLGNLAAVALLARDYVQFQRIWIMDYELSKFNGFSSRWAFLYIFLYVSVLCLEFVAGKLDFLIRKSPNLLLFSAAHPSIDCFCVQLKGD